MKNLLESTGIKTPATSIRRRIGLTVCLVVLIDALSCLSPRIELKALPIQADDNLRKLQREFTDVVQPLIRQHCNDCHSGDSADAGLNLDQFQQIDQILSQRKRWQKLHQRVTAREMPPTDAEPLDETGYSKLTSWLDRLLNIADCTNINPGRVTLRRLNRTEYRNTVRDLLGVDYQPAEDFPGDDVGYGFDNIADVISLPPILMEKYLSAAEEISQQAIVDPATPLLNRKIPLEDFKTGNGNRFGEGAIVLFAESGVTASVDLPQKGSYKIRVIASGDQAGEEPVRMSLGIKRKKAVIKPVRGNAEDMNELEFQITADKGKQQLQISFLNDFYEERPGEKAGDRNLYVHEVSIEGPAKRESPETNRKLIRAAVPNDPSEQQKLARDTLFSVGSRAFRRPLKKAEIDRFCDLFKTARSEGDGFEVALRFPLQAILISPNFLFKIESPPEPDKIRELNDYELATSLSYFLWSSMPDNQLFSAAARGDLRDPQKFRTQFERMLADPKSIALVENFASQWLQLPKLERTQPDPEMFPDVDLELRQDMIRQTQLTINDIIQNKKSILRLLDGEELFLNERLAKFYGLQDKFKELNGDEFRKVPSSDFGRVGILTQASFLTLTSNPTRTSPVKRGKWIMENFLGEEPPPQDPAAMPIEDQPELKGNLRQRMEQHRSDPNCAVCHKVMDQLGFALENFDAVGRWREKDEGLEIDARGELPSGLSFAGAAEMQRVIRDRMRTEFARCLTEKLLTYATGRGMEYYDKCAIDRIMVELSKKDFQFAELIYLITTSDPFRKRKG